MKAQLFGKCPRCNETINKDINNYFRKQPLKKYFEFECPECGLVMDVEIQDTLIPLYKDKKIE
jgi:phage FluMu protein Com